MKKVTSLLQKHQSRLYYLFIFIISFYVLTLNIASAITTNTNITSDIPAPEPYSSFFVQILDNPFSSTVLSALAIAVITYTVSKVRSIQSSLGDIQQLKKDQEGVVGKLDEISKKMDTRDTKYEQAINGMNEKMDSIKQDLDNKIWGLVMGKNNK